MTLLMTFVIAVKALRRNAMRTALTALGMIIGVAAVIVMVAIGTGARTSIEGQIRSAGSNLVMVNAGSGGVGPVRQGAGAVTTLTEADAEAIRRQVPGVRYVTPSLNTRIQIIAETANWNTQVQGVGEDLPSELGFECVTGMRARIGSGSQHPGTVLRLPNIIDDLRRGLAQADHSKPKALSVGHLFPSLF